MGNDTVDMRLALRFDSVCAPLLQAEDWGRGEKAEPLTKSELLLRYLGLTVTVTVTVTVTGDGGRVTGDG